MYAAVLAEAVDAGPPGRRRRRPSSSSSGPRRSRTTPAGRGYLDVFERAGVEGHLPGLRRLHRLRPRRLGRPSQVTVSAINRNYQGRSGPGQLYLASPLTVAASAIAGRIVPYEKGMFLAPEPVRAG